MREPYLFDEEDIGYKLIGFLFRRGSGRVFLMAEETRDNHGLDDAFSCMLKAEYARCMLPVRLTSLFTVESPLLQIQSSQLYPVSSTL
jgi:hypothetical protein